MESHTLARLPDDRYTCRACGWSWDHPPTSACPGLLRYRSLAQAPAGLQPEAARRPGARGCAATEDGWLYLYDAERAAAEEREEGVED